MRLARPDAIDATLARRKTLIGIGVLVYPGSEGMTIHLIKILQFNVESKKLNIESLDTDPTMVDTLEMLKEEEEALTTISNPISNSDAPGNKIHLFFPIKTKSIHIAIAIQTSNLDIAINQKLEDIQYKKNLQPYFLGSGAGFCTTFTALLIFSTFNQNSVNHFTSWAIVIIKVIMHAVNYHLYQELPNLEGTGYFVLCSIDQLLGAILVPQIGFGLLAMIIIIPSCKS